ncbi:hypothetical protein SB861_62590, partial [Paraburkholderia sp. SIMBA_049]
MPSAIAMTMYRVMLCFFFISNPNYGTCVSNGRSIAGIETGTEFRAHGVRRFECRSPSAGTATANRGGILSQTPDHLSILKG